VCCCSDALAKGRTRSRLKGKQTPRPRIRLSSSRREQLLTLAFFWSTESNLKRSLAGKNLKKAEKRASYVVEISLLPRRLPGAGPENPCEPARGTRDIVRYSVAGRGKILLIGCHRTFRPATSALNEHGLLSPQGL
jgi:hypothetical protein